MGRKTISALALILVAMAMGAPARAYAPAPGGAVGTVGGVVDDVTGTVGDLEDGLLGSPIPEPTTATTQQVEAAFFAATNAERTSRGLRPLVSAGDLIAVARRQSVRMAANGDIWHNLRLQYEIADWHDIGENVGRGPTVEEIQIAFMDSPHHRDNILDKTYTDVGIGASYGDGLIFITLDFASRQPGAIRPPPAVPQASIPTPDQPRSVSMLLELLSLDPPRGIPDGNETT